MRIFIGRYGHEGNTFSSKVTNFESFKEVGRWVRGETLLERFAGSPCFLGGIIDVGNANGITMYPSVSCEVAAPILSRECVNLAMKEILEDLSMSMEVGLDGICFMLHGAGYAEGIEDLESYVLERFREIVGDEIPIFVPLDLHANITPRMAELATLFGIKHYPHVDSRFAGALAMETCIESISKKRKPYTAYVRVPLLIVGSAGYTFKEPYLSIHRYFEDYKKKHGLIDITLFHGFPFCDAEFTSASIVVVSWDNPENHAKVLADYIWSRRDELVAESFSAAEALDKAESSGAPGYLVINELSDNPGAGAPGDGTHLLRELLKRNLGKSIFGFIYDKEAVKTLFRHSVGDKVSFSLGGNTEAIHGEPLWIEDAEILAFSNGDHFSRSPIFMGLPLSIGKCARVRVRNVEIIVGSIRTQTHDDRPFLVTGTDIEHYRYVCLKSAIHFRAFFDERAGEIIPCDTPGISSCNLTSYDYHRVLRPIYPLDREMHFREE